MHSIEEEGKTYEEALQKALNKMSVSEEKVNIEVIDSGKSKGFFSRKKNVRIKITMKEVLTENEKKDQIEQLLTKFLESMDINHNIKSIREGREKIYVDLNSTEEGIMIGKWGSTINSLQHLVNLIYNNKEQVAKKRIILNVGKYRKNREEILKNVALRYAEKVKETKKEIVLEPLCPEERKVIYMALDNDDAIRTFSKGTGEYRSVVMSPINSLKQ
ncbi:Jag N-terminal domain-containing protein [Candidatus Desantisbacteria bacterium]|nr:Jag N-terminal domain-containing protein [Candidatus Desantisbacteria bacterium]